MPEVSMILLFLLAALPLCATPGPGMLYVVSRGAALGRRAAMASSLGLSIGTLLHTSLIAVGLARLLTRVPLAYDALRLGGAAYLLWLGGKLLVARASEEPNLNAPPTAKHRLFLQGAIVGTLNPKVALFLLAFLPQFIVPERGRVWLQILILGLLYELLASVFNVTAGVLAGTAGTLFNRPTVKKRLNQVSGLVCVGLGVRLAIARAR